MSSITIRFDSSQIMTEPAEATRADVGIRVMDSPRNVSDHLRLLGLLLVEGIVLSDDDGALKIELAPKKKE